MIIKKLIKTKDETGRYVKVVSDDCEFHSFKDVLKYCFDHASKYYSDEDYYEDHGFYPRDMIAYQFKILDTNEDFGILCQHYKNVDSDDVLEYQVCFNDDPFYDSDSILEDKNTTSD